MRRPCFPIVAIPRPKAIEKVTRPTGRELKLGYFEENIVSLPILKQILCVLFSLRQKYKTSCYHGNKSHWEKRFKM